MQFIGILVNDLVGLYARVGFIYETILRLVEFEWDQVHCVLYAIFEGFESIYNMRFIGIVVNYLVGLY